MTSIDIDELDDANEQRKTFRYANGAPLVSDPDDPTKTLRYSRPSGYSKCLDDEKALESWRLFKAMTGVARSKALAAEVNACKDEDKVQKEILRNKALDKGDASERADMGTALHAMTVRAEDETDTDFDPPEQYVADLDAYRDALATYGLVSEMVEVALVNDEYRAAGTADRIFRTTKPLIAPDEHRIEPGELILGDLKTGQKLDFSLPNYCVQMALYATGKLYDVHTDKRLATPPINSRWTLLIHLPVGKAQCEVLWCSIEAGLHGAKLAREVKEWRKQWKNGTYDAPVAGVPVDPVAECISQFNAEIVEIDLQTMTDYCQRRINQIGLNARARQHLITFWPDSLPSPKKGLASNEQLIMLLNYLDSVEKQFDMPFMVDPRTDFQRGKHRSEVDRSNAFLLGIN